VKAFVGWVLAQRQRLIIIAVVAAPLLPIVTVALAALETVRRGVAQGLVSSVIGLGALIGLAALARTDLAVFATIGVTTFGVGVGLGALLRRAGNLALAFQGVTLLGLATVAAMSLFGPDPQALFQPLIDEFAQVLRLGGATEQEIAAVSGRSGVLLLAAGVFSQLLGALLLAYWWCTLAAGERRFGAEFRRLRLGRWLGAVATALLGLALVFDVELVQNLAPLALLGFLFQGFAVLHAWAHAKRWHPGLIAPAYVLLVTPLTVVIVLVFSVVGLVDNWINLRPRLGPQA
jgi:hypothetical protein